ncbi:MAG: M13 family metallopeptidase [Alistipes sp.]|nr:M13 family metallopeptidase [Candidatus Alistipes equi]
MKKGLIIFVFASLILSCQRDPIITPPIPFPSNELVDESVKPGDDFYNYCNGAWIKKNPLPVGQSSKMYWIDSKYSVSEFQKVILASDDPVVKKLLKDIDNHDLSDAAIAKLQAKTKQQLQEIDNLKTIRDVIKKVGQLSMKGYKPLLTLHSQPVEGRVQIVVEVIDPVPPVATTLAWQKTTGCSESEANTLSKKCEDIQSKFLSYRGIAIRTKPYEGNEIVDGRRYLAEAVGVSVERMIYGETIDQDEFMKNCVNEQNVENWKMILKDAIVFFNYRWTYATKEELATYLTQAYHPFAYRMTKLYSETFKDMIMRDFTITMTKELKEAFIELIQQNTWLAESTRYTALEKAQKLDCYIGYPDSWQEERMGSVPTGLSLLEDMEQIGNEWYDIVLASINDTPSRDDMWYSLTQAHTSLYHVNAMNTTESNGLCIYMPMLMPNVCRSNVPDSYNYAMVGAVIGHEFGHGFDTAGYQFGPKGEWNNWWTAQDKTTFLAKTKDLAKYYSEYRPYPEKYPDLYANGEQTSVEDVADLNGVNAAYRAMLNHYIGKGASNEELLQAKREFFLAYGNLWAGAYSEEYILRIVKTNIHSIAPLRVNMVVRQMDEWYEAYDIKPGDKLYIEPSKRVKIWNE